MDETKKTKASKKVGTKNFRKTFRFIKPHKKYFIPMVILQILGNALILLIPLVEAQQLNAFVEFDLEKILILGGIVLGIFTLSRGLQGIFQIFAHKFSNFTRNDLRRNLISSVIDLETKNFDTKTSGGYINTVTNDCNQIPAVYREVLASSTHIIAGVVNIIIVFFLSPWMALFFTLAIASIYIFGQLRVRSFFRYQKIYRKEYDKEVGFESEVLRGIRDVKALNLKNNVLTKAGEYIEKSGETHLNVYLKDNWKKRGIEFWNGIIDFVFYSLAGCLIFFGHMTLASFLVVFMYKNRIFGIVNYIASAQQQLIEGEFAAERIFDVIEGEDYPKEKWGKTELELPVRGEISFKDVSFSYNEEQVLKNLSLDIPANSCTALVGKSGIGKSTILSLITRNYDIMGGSITLDGTDVRELTENALRNNISAVPQTPYIFNITVAENLRLVRPNATDEEIQIACKKAQIHDFIDALPEKYDTLLGENGIVLSGGQKQRLAIARALLKDSKVILLDEATSALDNESQGKIKQVIRDLSDSHTVLIVAHRLSTIVDADKIIVLNEHGIVAEGTHENLLSSCSEYNSLYKNES